MTYPKGSPRPRGQSLPVLTVSPRPLEKGYNPTPAGQSAKSWSSVASLSARGNNAKTVQIKVKEKQQIGKKSNAKDMRNTTRDGKEPASPESGDSASNDVAIKAGEPETNNTPVLIGQAVAPKTLWSQVAAFRNPNTVAITAMTPGEYQYWENKAAKGKRSTHVLDWW